MGVGELSFISGVGLEEVWLVRLGVEIVNSLP